MAETSTIEWTDATWNPVTGCTMVSAGCTNCYAMTLAAGRLQKHPSREGLTRITGGRPVWTGEVRLNEQWLDQPLRWKRPRRIFVCAHGDLFHEAVPDEWIDRVFAVMALAPRHTFQVLTKRPERAREYLSAGLGPTFRIARACQAFGGMPDEVEVPLPNVWLGTSIEDQATADARIPHLLATPAAVRFVSAEPLLGPVDLTEVAQQRPDLRASVVYDALRGTGGFGEIRGRIDWVIVGGESGKRARPMHPDWARSLRDQCQAAGVAFFFKQWGEWRETDGPLTCRAHRVRVGGTHWLLRDGTLISRGDGTQSIYRDYVVGRLGKETAGRLLDGRTWDQMPGVDHA